MREIEQSAPNVHSPSGGLLGMLPAAWLGVRRYLDKQFAPAHMASTCILVVVSYFLYARIAGISSFGYEVGASAVTVVLIFLQMRLAEDVDIHWSGGELLGQVGWHRPQTYRGHARIVLPDGRVVPRPLTLWAATVATTGVIVALNLPLGRPGIVAALSGPGLLIIAYGALRLRVLPRIFGLVAGFELVPALAYLYVYFAWQAHTHVALSPAAVIPVVVTFWASWEFWKVSRGIGKYERERAYGLSPKHTCIASLGFVGLALPFQIALWSRADLSVLYLAFVVGLTAFTALGIGTTMRSLRRAGHVEGGVPHWAGLAFPAAVLAGLGVQLLVFSL
jgi:hypothetical protein